MTIGGRRMTSRSSPKARRGDRSRHGGEGKGADAGVKMADSPEHVAIIMDGNGRWARSRGMPRPAGHRASVKVVRRVVEECAKRKVRYLTLFAFSSENWRRPADEVGMLMSLFLDALEREVADLHRNQVRLSFIGDRAQLGIELARRMRAAEQ